MFKSIIGLFIMVAVASAAPRSGSVDTFKKEMTPLQSAVDSAVNAAGAQVMDPSEASYLEGYGVVVVLKVSFERPRGPFASGQTPAQSRVLVEQRRTALTAKLSDLLKDRIGKTESIGGSESMAIIVHILNANPADVSLPMQMIFTVKKDSPAQVVTREF